MNTNNAIRPAHFVSLIALLGVSAIALIGCQNTAEGVKEDTQKNGQAMQSAADNAADRAKEAAHNTADATKDAAKSAGDAAKDAGDALNVIPKVHTAILNNTSLSDTRNHISVDRKDDAIYLRGHVATAELKKTAGDLAAKTIKEAQSKDRVVNELKVDAH